MKAIGNYFCIMLWQLLGYVYVSHYDLPSGLERVKLKSVVPFLNSYSFQLLRQDVDSIAHLSR